MALWCMASRRELMLLALTVLSSCATLAYAATPDLVVSDILVMAAVAIVSVVPLMIGILYEFFLNLNYWFVEVDEDGVY